MDKDQGATERKGKLAKEFDELMKVIEPLDRSLQGTTHTKNEAAL